MFDNCQLQGLISRADVLTATNQLVLRSPKREKMPLYLSHLEDQDSVAPM